MDEFRSDMGPFAIVPLWLIEAVSPRALQVFALMAAKWTNRETGQCFPFQDTIAEILDVTRETVNRSVKELREAGAVSVEEQFDAHGFRKQSLYTIYYTRPAVVTSMSQPSDGCDVDVTTGCVIDVTTAVSQMSQQREQESTNQNHPSTITSLIASEPSLSLHGETQDLRISEQDRVPPLSYPSGTTPTPTTQVDPTIHGPEGNSTGRPKVDDDPDPEAVRLCELIADLYQTLGNTRPNPNQKAWHKAMRLLMTKDGPDGKGWTPDKIELIIRWALADDFWQANIRSAPKLREKFDQLRAARNRNLSASTGKVDPIAAALERAAQRNAS